MTTIKLRRDTSANWVSVNPVLAEGEVGIDTSNNYIKIGDGSTVWSSLPYTTISPDVLQVALDDKVDYFEVDSPLTETWQVNSNAELSANASVSDSGILTDTTYADYWALQNTTIGNYIDNQMSYWHIHFKFKTSNNNELQPFFGLADGAGEYDVNFIELKAINGYLRTLNEATNIPIPTNTWIEVDIEHLEGASTASAKVNVNGTVYTVNNIIKNNYTLSSAKGVEWLGLGATPFEHDITWNGFHIHKEPNGAKYCLLTDRHLGLDLVNISEIYVATYGTTTYSEITTALSNYKTVICNDSGRLYYYIRSTGGYTFGSTFGINSDYVFVNSSSVWSRGSVSLANITLSNVSSIDSGSAIATALNGKADTDLSNLSATGKTVIDGQWVSANISIGTSDTSLNGSTELPYTLSDVPNDGHEYEVVISVWGTTGSTNGNGIEVQVRSDKLTDWINVCRATTRTSSTATCSGNIILPLTISRKIYVRRGTGWNGTFTAQLKGYRRIGSNT